ncbi:MAG: nucleoside phosphorylase [Propionibacteriaceae bacterium]|nr:nucleoside phosphorylase [Propionibacteriaceae bacterium]
MPITQSFDPDGEEVISPYQTAHHIASFPETMIVTFQPKTFAVLLELYAVTPIADLYLEEAVDQDLPIYPGRAYTFDYRGTTLGACLSPVGAPTTVAVLEKAIALGTRSFVVFGSCGALVPNVAAQGIIVPTSAYRDEGTSYHYAPASDYISVDTADRTAEILSELAIPHTSGKVWTTDAFFRETTTNLAKRVSEGCIAVDMETSALAALAQFRHVAIHQFLYAADSLTEDEWDPRILGNLPREQRARYIQMAVEIALRL